MVNKIKSLLSNMEGEYVTLSLSGEMIETKPFAELHISDEQRKEKTYIVFEDTSTDVRFRLSTTLIEDIEVFDEEDFLVKLKNGVNLQISLN